MILAFCSKVLYISLSIRGFIQKNIKLGRKIALKPLCRKGFR
jgi:hypothetical protein